MLTTLRLLAIGLVGAAAFGPSAAYEDDVHYGLTRWLAAKAGFNAAQAQTIASANVAYDHSVLSAVALVYHAACKAAKDKVASEEVQRIHFPGEGAVPGPPKQRAVKAGSTAARAELEAALQIPTDTPEHRLRRFGKSLHPFQDSWSHRGEPDSPFDFPAGCDRDYSWGHPAARGGWRSHAADLTHRDPSSALAMAEATHGALCDYRRRVLGERCGPKFELLAPDVTELLRAGNKTDKAAWFRSRGFDDVRFLHATNVRDGGRPPPRHEPIRQTPAGPTQAPQSRSEALPRTPAADFMRRFFQAWMTRNDLDTVAEEWIALDGYRADLGHGAVRRIGAVTAEAQLRLWRVRDHGAVESALDGHDLSSRVYSTIPERLRIGEAPYPSLDAALLPLDADGLPIASWMSTRHHDREQLLVGAARFRHAPGDLVIVVAGRVDGQFKVVTIESIVTQ